MLLEREDTRTRLVVETIGGSVGERSLPLIFRRAPTTSGGAEFFGCEFDTMQSEEYFVLADLMYGDSEALPRFLQRRRKHKNLWAGTGQFIWWGVVEPIRAFAYLRKTRAKGKPKVETAPAPELPPVASTAWLRRLVRQAVEGETKLEEEEAIAPAARKSA